eukprot:2039758-Pleurochrysis_carterae.AAC.2
MMGSLYKAGTLQQVAASMFERRSSRDGLHARPAAQADVELRAAAADEVDLERYPGAQVTASTEGAELMPEDHYTQRNGHAKQHACAVRDGGSEGAHATAHSHAAGAGACNGDATASRPLRACPEGQELSWRRESEQPREEC